MHAAISRTELVSLIGKLQSVVSSKPALPILANILIEAKNDQLVISATDLTVSALASLSCDIKEEGAIVLPARRFFQLCRELTSAQIEITCSAGEIAIIRSGSSQFRLHGMHKSEFPDLPTLDGGKEFTIESDTLKAMLTRTDFSAAREDSRQVLNGIFMSIENSEATFYGTDGKRLAKVKTPVNLEPDFKGGYLIPLKAVEEMCKVLTGNTSVKCFLFDDKIALDIGHECVISKLLPGEYPEVDRIIPVDPRVSVSLHREELITLLKQTSVFTSDKNLSVHFQFVPGELKLLAASSDIGEGQVSMPVNYAGEEIEIAFNPAYFLDILRHSKDEIVTLGITDAHSPGIITDSSSATFVIMPMRLQKPATV